MQNVILNSVIQRLQRYSAKYFCTQEYKITNAVWNKLNKKAIITLDKPLKQYLGLPQKIVVENIPYTWEVQDISIDLLSRSILTVRRLSCVLPDLYQSIFPVDSSPSIAKIFTSTPFQSKF